MPRCSILYSSTKESAFWHFKELLVLLISWKDKLTNSYLKGLLVTTWMGSYFGLEPIVMRNCSVKGLFGG